jgi:hypothetical protein
MQKLLLASALFLALSANAAEDLLDIKGTGKTAANDCLAKATRVMEQAGQTKTVPLPEAFFEKCYEKITTDWDGPAEQKPTGVAQCAFALGYGTMAMTMANAFKGALKPPKLENKTEK